LRAQAVAGAGVSHTVVCETPEQGVVDIHSPNCYKWQYMTDNFDPLFDFHIDFAELIQPSAQDGFNAAAQRERFLGGSGPPAESPSFTTRTDSEGHEVRVEDRTEILLHYTELQGDDRDGTYVIAGRTTDTKHRIALNLFRTDSMPAQAKIAELYTRCRRRSGK
jgi:hypothetical protein